MKQLDYKSIKIIKGLPPIAKKGDKVSIDTEFFGQDKARLHRPHGQFAFMGCTFDGKAVYYVTDPEKIQEFLGRLEEAVWIFVNAKYDFTQLRRFARIPDRNRLWDCFLIEQIMYSGYYSGFSLADMARRRLDLYLPKEMRKEFSEQDELPVESEESTGRSAPNPDGQVGGYGKNAVGLPVKEIIVTRTITREQLEYAAGDVVTTWLVYQSQRAEIDDTDLTIWKEIELPFLWTILDMRGMTIDLKVWTDLYERNRAEADAILESYIEYDKEKYSLQDAIKKKKYTGINLGSSDQVGQEILRRGYKLPKTKTGKPSTNEDDIKHLAHDEFVRDVLEYRGKSKLASTYGSSWVNKELIESDGRVYSAFNQIGAATGRISSSKPNVENIPIRETPEFREAFVAEPGCVVIDADWSSQEPRIAAYLSEDEKLIQIFKDKKDVYIESARLMFGWELDKKDPRRKDRMKPTVLGASYGLTEYGMEKKYGIPLEEGKELLATFFDTFEGMARWKKSQQEIKDVVTTIYGRKFWLNPYAQGSENNALNSPVQGSGGDGIKIAGATFRDEIYKKGYEKEVFIINFIHDEILAMCKTKRAKWAMETLKRVMIETAEAMHDGIPADVEVNSGKNWAEAHG